MVSFKAIVRRRRICDLTAKSGKVSQNKKTSELLYQHITITIPKLNCLDHESEYLSVFSDRISLPGFFC